MRQTKRFSGVLATAAAAGSLALVQGVLMLLRHQGSDLQLAFWMARLGLLTGVVTVLLFVPLALVARRWHPRDRAGDRQRAWRSLLFGFVAALGGWTNAASSRR